MVLEVNQEKQLSVSDELSDNANMNLISSAPSIATIDANDKVKALKPGNTIITCTSKDIHIPNQSMSW
ncbi:Ig-like domain-containing protein [Ruminiclostridium cellobioparum]|uniref:Ig-like domain-containing protein n=1 Tax=Ruminiclostridium cellobioparum TaxID=29355 RepID=UPI00138E10E1